MPVSRELLSTPLARGHDFTNHRRERLILLTILNHPTLLERHEEAFLTIDLASPELDKLREATLRIAAACHDAGKPLDSCTLKNHLLEEGLDKAVKRLEGDKGLVGDAFARPEADLEMADQGLRSLLQASQLQLLQEELQAAELDAMSDDAAEAERGAHRARDLRSQIERLMARQADIDSGFDAGIGAG